MSVFRNLLMKITGWLGKPADWSDIRKDCPANSIALYAAHADDYSQYDNLGLTATCVGGYNVYIDGTQFGTTYASGTQCNITWSTSGITTGEIITTPSLLKAHKIWIEPATEGNNITVFKCLRVAVSGDEQQGVLWAHFNITNEIDLTTGFTSYITYRNPMLLAITVKNNLVKVKGFAFLFGESADVFTRACNPSYAPVFDLNNNTMSGTGTFNVLTTAELQEITLKNGTINNLANFATNATKLKRVKAKNVSFIGSNFNDAFKNNQSLEQLPEGLNWSSTTQAIDFLTNANNLKDTVLDVSAATGLTKIGCYGTSSYFMSGFKGLRVSNEAPFNHATAPQINVSYTGMDRSALVQLFNDLPTVTGGQIINITGCTGSEDLIAEDIAIATNKGWSVSGGPAFEDYYAYTNENDNTDTLYTKDNPIHGSSFVLSNATEAGTLNKNNGIYSGFSEGNYIKLNTSSPTTSLEFIFAFTPDSTNPGDILRSQPDGAGILLRDYECYLSSNGSGWDVLSGFDTGLTYTEGVLNYIKITWDSTNGIYTFWQSLDGETWTEKNSSDSGKAAVYWNNTQTLGACSGYSEHFNGSFDITKTKAVIDGVTVNFGYFSTPSVLYDDEFTQLSPQPTFTIQEAGLVDANKVGELTDTNGVYSGFGNNNYISADTALPASITSADIIFKAKITSFDDHSVFMGNKSTEQYYGVRSYKKFSIYNSGWTEGTNELDANKFYWFRVIFDGTNWTGYTIEDSDYTYATLPVISQWRTEWTTTENGAASWIKGAAYNVGRNTFANGEYMHGDIDMPETKLTINGITTILYKDISSITVTSVLPNVTYNRNISKDTFH